VVTFVHLKKETLFESLLFWNSVSNFYLHISPQMASAVSVSDFPQTAPQKPAPCHSLAVSVKSQ